MTTSTTLPVAVIGAGPVGLAAAAHLAERGIPFIVFELGERVGRSITEWGQVRLFSPWEFLTDAAATRLLGRAGWQAPPSAALPTGHDVARDYLVPLAATPELAPHLRFGAEVIAVTRADLNRTVSLGRELQPFLLRLRGRDGTVTEALASAVIDASGTWRTPNPLGANGLEPLGADTVSEHLARALPDVLGRDRARFAGRHTVVVGSGHSAANTLLALATLADEEPGTRATWLLRRAASPRVYGSSADELPARARLGAGLHELVSSGRIDLVERFSLSTLERVAGRVRLHGTRRGDPVTLDADIVVNSTGFQPDLAPLREIRLELDTVVEAPLRLAPLIDPNLHSCGTVPPHGEAELAHPEKDFYLVGVKSYGRAPTFLLATGYEQVRSVVAALAGDHEAAREVHLALPETGVCSTDIRPASAGSDAATGAATDAASDAASTTGADAGSSGAPASCCGAPAPLELTLGGRTLA